MDINKSNLEKMIKEILLDKLSVNIKDEFRNEESGIIAINIPKIKVEEKDRMDTGNKISDKVYTKDLFTLSESPRLGCGIMEMTETTFDWTLNYDEIDYIIEGKLSIIINGKSITASQGELILIPKGSNIKFSAENYARFLYVTYPADWASQNK